MLAYIEGRLDEIQGNSCIVITASGLGYELALPAHTLAALPAKGENVHFYTNLVVREDAQELYGFESFSERTTFQLLLSISKVGARTALSILSLYRPDDLQQMAFDDDCLALTRVPGIGKKSAQHIFLELKDKLKGGKPGREKKQIVTSDSNLANSVYRDAMDGLAGLGYGEAEASPVLRKILAAEPDLDVAETIRAFLKAQATRNS